MIPMIPVSVVVMTRNEEDNLPARPLLVFLYGYVVRLGFLDGGPGFQHALARAFYYWQIGVKIADARRRAVPRASASD